MSLTEDLTRISALPDGPQKKFYLIKNFAAVISRHNADVDLCALSCAQVSSLAFDAVTVEEHGEDPMGSHHGRNQ